MKTNFTKNKTAGYLLLVLLALGLPVQQAYAQFVSYTFTPCGATGQMGPNQGQATTAYSSNNLAGLVTISGQGVQQFLVTTTGLYGIDCFGAQGGSYGGFAGGLGARAYGEVNLTAGTVINVLVGQVGNVGNAGGGGGGSGVYAGANCYVAAGGGGGAATNGEAGGPGLITTTGGLSSGVGGTNGNGGGKGFSTGDCGFAGGGGGFLGSGFGNTNSPNDGGVGTPGGPGGGASATNGGVGGIGGGCNNLTTGHGGFGFGAGGHGSYGGGGGGGYSGGGGGQYVSPVGQRGGGGGGSFNSGTNQTNTQGINSGAGRVVITRLCNISLVPSSNPICIGQSVVLTTDAASGILWSNMSTANSITVTPTGTTNYSVTGTSTANCVSGSLITITVNPLPVLNTVVSPTMLCVGNTATVTASGAATYTWNNGPTGISLTANPGVTTTYNLSGTSQFGCINSTPVVVNVNSNSLTVNSTTAVCLGSAVNLVASGAVTYTWSNGSNFATVPVTPGQSTTYTINAIDNYGCALSNQVAVTVNPKPTVGGSTNKPMACKWDMISLIGTGATTYTWSNGSTGTPVQVSVPVDVIYTFTVTGTDNNGCTNTAIVNVNVNKCVGIEEASAGSLGVVAYPNPASDQLTIELDNGAAKSVSVTDLSGRTVLTAVSGASSFNVDLSTLSNGVYYVKIISDEKSEVIKIVKQSGK